MLRWCVLTILTGRGGERRGREGERREGKSGERARAGRVQLRIIFPGCHLRGRRCKGCTTSTKYEYVQDAALGSWKLEAGSVQSSQGEQPTGNSRPVDHRAQTSSEHLGWMVSRSAANHRTRWYFPPFCSFRSILHLRQPHLMEQVSGVRQAAQRAV
jgi:hypothetical protein